jgi:hypothetical protein
MLQIVVFSVIFAIALAMLDEEKRRPLLSFAESLAETMFRFTRIVMLFAPIGVGAAIAYTVGSLGVGILVNLFKLLATFYVAVAVFVVGVLLPVALMAKVPLKRFIAAVAEPVSIAFATTSSEAALPRAMQAMERIGVPRQDCRVRDADRLHVQSRWQHALLVADLDLRCAGGGHSVDDRTAVRDAPDAHAVEQRRCGSATRSCGRALRHDLLVQPTGRTGARDSGDRRGTRYAADVAQRPRQLSRYRGDSSLGR